MGNFLELFIGRTPVNITIDNASIYIKLECPQYEDPMPVAPQITKNISKCKTLTFCFEIDMILTQFSGINLTLGQLKRSNMHTTIKIKSYLCNLELDANT